jgi:CO/xanthine dehydrogenase FAD-binding subunit
MLSGTRQVRVFTPHTIPDLLALTAEYPDALLYAGGSYILSQQSEGVVQLPPVVIAVAHIYELSRISRSEGYLEIGATATLDRVLGIGRHVLPAVLHDALQGIGPPSIHNIGTIGGNLCVAGRRLDLFPVLHVLDARLEIRSTNGTRWVSINRLVDVEGNTTIKPGEVLTRVRVPFADWQIQRYRKVPIPTASGFSPMSFCGVARLQKSLISDLRFAFNAVGPGVLRNREVETDLVGRKLPLAPRDRQSLEDALSPVLRAEGEELGSFQRSRIRATIRWFMAELSGAG